MSLTVLVTGGTGFLGSHLVYELLEKRYNVIVLKRSSSNLWRLKDVIGLIKWYDYDVCNINTVFSENLIDVVIHTACCYGRNGESLSTIIETNILFGLRLFELANTNSVSCFINTDTLLPRNVSSYSISKSQLREWLEFTKGNIKVINMQIEHMYGPKDDATKFVQRLLGQLIGNVESIPLTSGIQERDFVYITDVVSAFLTVIDKKEELSAYTNFQIASGSSVQVKSFVEELYYQFTNLHPGTLTKLSFGVVPYRIGEVLTLSVDISKLLDLGWKPTISFKEGIAKILESQK